MVAALGCWPRVYGLLRNLWDSPAMRRRIYGPRLLDQSLPDAFDEQERLWPDAEDSGGDPVVAAALFERRHKMVDDLLWQEDRASMEVGLEVRVPFVDLPLWQSVEQLPRTTLMPGGRLKGYLRHQLAGVVPAEIMNRPKSGFQVDAPQFYHTHLASLAEEWLSEDAVRRYGLFNPPLVAELRRLAPVRGHRWHYFMLYLMLLTHLWVDQFER